MKNNIFPHADIWIIKMSDELQNYKEKCGIKNQNLQILSILSVGLIASSFGK